MADIAWTYDANDRLPNAGNITYDDFGNTSHGLGSSPNPYQFNGQANDGTGLYFLRARYYNPSDGRFLSQDPLMGSEADSASLHRYLYASGDPVNRMDPGGREDFSLTGVLAATGVASSLGGTLDAAEFAIKDEFAAAGVDISQERVIAATITGNLGLGNGWRGPIQRSAQANHQSLTSVPGCSTGPERTAGARRSFLCLMRCKRPLSRLPPRRLPSRPSRRR